MTHTATTASAIYVCPMHSDVHEAEPGLCPKCGMDLVTEGRFALLRHMLSNPFHVAMMTAVMIAIMAGAMMLMR